MIQIKKPTLDFLADLRDHNDRDWFQKNRKRYEDAKNNFEQFVQELITGISEFDPILKGLEAKTCTYRIYRDIRFSNDKTIYKSHMGAFIVRGGKNNGSKYAGYYFHIEPGNNSMIAGGAYMPPTPWLTSIRENIGENGDRLLKIITDKGFTDYFGDLEGEKLKTAPKGFPKDHKYIELLKMKSYLAARTINDNEVLGAGCYDLVLKGAGIMKPLNDFLNDYEAWG
jgi:uncharacterized protein (TIGR02453 family)